MGHEITKHSLKTANSEETAIKEAPANVISITREVGKNIRRIKLVQLNGALVYRESRGNEEK